VSHADDLDSDVRRQCAWAWHQGATASLGWTEQNRIMTMKMTIADKLLSRSKRDEYTGCLRWTGAHNSRGYGYAKVSGHSGPQRVHRVAYELWIGPIPEGYDVDHVRERGCVYHDCFEPSHLEAVTHWENVRRVTVFRTHCPNGHEFTPDNTGTRKRRGHTSRTCKTCHRAPWRTRAGSIVDRGNHGVYPGTQFPHNPYEITEEETQ